MSIQSSSHLAIASTSQIQTRRCSSTRLNSSHGPARGDLHRIWLPHRCWPARELPNPARNGWPIPRSIVGGGGAAEATFPSLHLTSVCVLCQPRAGLYINQGHAKRRSQGAGDLANCLAASIDRSVGALLGGCGLRLSQIGNSIRNPSNNGIDTSPIKQDSQPGSQLSGVIAFSKPRELFLCPECRLLAHHTCA